MRTKQQSCLYEITDILYFSMKENTNQCIAMMRITDMIQITGDISAHNHGNDATGRMSINSKNLLEPKIAREGLKHDAAMCR